MLAAPAPRPTIGAVVLFVVDRHRARLRLHQHPPARRPRSARRSSWPPTASPTTPTRSSRARKLDRTLTLGLLGLFVIAVGLPLYWLDRAGPAGRRGRRTSRRKFVKPRRGAVRHHREGRLQLRLLPRRHGGRRRCGADYTITDANGEFVEQVKWKAPALNTVLLRYSRDEVRYILTYGRPFSPMPAWGVKGGGPLNDQQLQNLIDYLETHPAHARRSRRSRLDRA